MAKEVFTAVNSNTWIFLASMLHAELYKILPNTPSLKALGLEPSNRT